MIKDLIEASEKMEEINEYVGSQSVEDLIASATIIVEELKSRGILFIAGFDDEEDD